ncbi:MAG: NAD(P)-dependent oxidoreductase [Methanomassiliicoccales archaeon]|jgi:GDP-L-fucose synthase
MRVFLTGGRGFIGRNLIERLNSDIEIVAPTSRELDLTDQYAVERYIAADNFDVVLHTATWNATANSAKDLQMILEKNLAMFFNLVRLNENYGKMIYYGSGAEYDRRNYLPFMAETYFDRNIPVDQYGFSKYIMSKYIEKMDNILDLRVFGCYGPHEDWEIRFISNAMCKALHGLPITIRQNVLFDYIWVGDLVRITEWAMRNETKYNHYNACTGKHVDLLTLAHLIREVTGADVPIQVAQEGFKPEYSGDNSRIMEEMQGFEYTPLRAALEMLRDHYLDSWASIDSNLLLHDKH